ncbi:urea transporter [Lachnoclostridium phytofermentans]|uniref:Urea transporter n=1 Tax=Lachnoclostridium phytofermentans (strain ATCC 700394 / DSM 18823 / ISDg) TaxID=357809 RepID=A9KJR4_LACP7|nr:urea transporter [Lachnoclostridium phytofermentans]ABX41069.1 Urea transporter [Lachnoclostridium phytofermentans ISDg]
MDKLKTENKNLNLNNLITASLKGISQVILVENTLSGLIILIAITFSDYKLGIIALISSMIGALTGHITGVNKNTINQGLLGYNSVLIGLALSIFFMGYNRWWIALLGAFFVAILTAAMNHFFSNLKIPVLTFPYIILTWLFILAGYHLQVFKLASVILPQDLASWHMVNDGNFNLLNGLVNGVGQVYFQTFLISGILILVAIFWDNWKSVMYAIIGTIVGFATAYCLGSEFSLLNQGLYGFNAVLTALAISKVFDADRPFAPLTGVIASILTVPITAAIDTWLMPYGIPGLTMPFVLVTWMFLGARKVMPKL